MQIEHHFYEYAMMPYGANVPYRPRQYQMRLWQPVFHIFKDIRQILYHMRTSLIRLPNDILIEDIVRESVCEEHGIPVEYRHSIFYSECIKCGF